MAILCFSDILQKAGLDPAKVKLIRHALTDKGFKECYDKGMVGDEFFHRFSFHRSFGFPGGCASYGDAASQRVISSEARHCALSG